jgi:hypothetical protein
MATTRKSRQKKAAVATAPSGDVAAAAQKFNRDLLIRGDAAPLDEHGKLPLTATHEVVKDKETDGSTAKIVRRRFKMF